MSGHLSYDGFNGPEQEKMQLLPACKYMSSWDRERLTALSCTYCVSWRRCISVRIKAILTSFEHCQVINCEVTIWIMITVIQTQLLVSLYRICAWAEDCVYLHSYRTLSSKRALAPAVHGWLEDELHCPVGCWSVVSCMIMSINSPMTIGK